MEGRSSIFISQHISQWGCWEQDWLIPKIRNWDCGEKKIKVCDRDLEARGVRALTEHRVKKMPQGAEAQKLLARIKDEWEW